MPADGITMLGEEACLGTGSGGQMRAAALMMMGEEACLDTAAAVAAHLSAAALMLVGEEACCCCPLPRKPGQPLTGAVVSQAERGRRLRVGPWAAVPWVCPPRQPGPAGSRAHLRPLSECFMTEGTTKKCVSTSLGLHLQPSNGLIRILDPAGAGGSRRTVCI